MLISTRLALIIANRIPDAASDLSIIYFEGTASADGRTITQECCYDDPVKAPSVLYSVTMIKDENTLEYEMYLTPSGGKEEKMLETTATRKESVARRAA